MIFTSRMEEDGKLPSKGVVDVFVACAVLVKIKRGGEAHEGFPFLHENKRDLKVNSGFFHNVTNESIPQRRVSCRG